MSGFYITDESRFYITDEFVEDYKDLCLKRVSDINDQLKEHKFLERLNKHKYESYDYEKLNEDHLLERLELYQKLILLTPKDSPLKNNLYNSHAHLMMVLTHKL